MKKLYIHLIGGILALLVGGIVVLAAISREPITVNSTTPSTRAIRPGQTITVYWSMNVNKNCAGQITDQQLIDSSGRVYKFAPAPIDLKTDNVEQVIKVPHSVQSGQLRYVTTIKYACGFFNRWSPVVVKTNDIIGNIRG